MKDPKLADMEKINYFFDCCTIAERNDQKDLIKEKLMFKDPFFQQTAAHSCSKNGHVAILVRIIKLFPEMSKVEDA